MASAADLLEDSDEDKINDELLEFYTSNLQFLKKVPLNKVSPVQFRKIAVILHSISHFGYQWREYGFNFGIENNYDLHMVEQSAKTNNELPIYMVLVELQQRGNSFGLVIEKLIHMRRLDVLLELRIYVDTLLKTDYTVCSKDTSVEMGMSAKEESFSADTMQETLYVSQNSDEKDENCDKKIPSVAREHEFMLKFSENTLDLKDKCSNLCDATEICLNIEPRPSAPAQQKLRVFIMHTDENKSDADRLSAILREQEFSVIKYSDIFPFTLVNSMGALTSVFLLVDYIIPIVSQSFLNEIYPQDFARYTESDDAMNNRCLYQLLLNECKRNMCYNFRVRPVIIPGFKKSLLPHDFFLPSSLRLWSEVSKLISALQSSRHMLPDFLPS